MTLKACEDRSSKLFDKLHNVGIEVERPHQFYPFFSTYDFESILKKITPDEGLIGDVTTSYTHEHIPISVSICSNVPGFTEPYCIVEEGDDLLDEMFKYLSMIQQCTSNILLKKFSSIFIA